MTSKIAVADTTGGCDRQLGITRSLLGWGIVAGPVYLVAGLTQAFTRPGFDIGRHALSLLENGHLGWIQIGNFLLTGLMVVAGAIGVRRVLHPGRGGTAGPLLVGAYGAGVFLAGIFHADPTDGFPPGTPPGPGETTWHGLLHMASFGVGFLCLIAACFVVARGLSARGQRRSAWGSRVAGLALFACVVATFAAAGTTVALVALWAAVVLAWAWVTVVSARLMKEAGSAR
ncbi:MAG TPA: DUF998 domain-containing protein [Streptosporangiales bacterium]